MYLSEFLIFALIWNGNELQDNLFAKESQQQVGTNRALDIKDVL